MQFPTPTRGLIRSFLGGLVAALALCVFAPQVLAFPYARQVGDTAVYSDTPISPAIVQVLVRSDALLRKSAIYGPGYGRRIFLTDGGWRWKLLSLQAPGALANTRAFSEPIVINTSDVARDVVSNGRTIGGARSLSATIAHERTHGLIRARYGELADIRYPAWLREGYCDYVAGGGTLSDADVALLQRRHKEHPALLYYWGRKRVEATLRANGGSVDRMFAEARTW